MSSPRTMADHGQAEGIAQAAFDQVTVGEHRSRRARARAAGGCGRRRRPFTLRPSKAQLMSATGPGGPPLPAHPAPPAAAVGPAAASRCRRRSLTCLRVGPMQRQHMHPVMPPQAALLQRGPQQRRPFGHESLGQSGIAAPCRSSTRVGRLDLEMLAAVKTLQVVGAAVHDERVSGLQDVRPAGGPGSIPLSAAAPPPSGKGPIPGGSRPGCGRPAAIPGDPGGEDVRVELVGSADVRSGCRRPNP